MMSVMNTTMSTGERSGAVIRRNTCHSLAPSTRAASWRETSMAESPEAIMTMAKPAQIQT